jgi:pilus assembly protein Flp/PilA
MNTVFSALYARVIWPVRDRLNSEDGLEAVEYALIAALLAVVIIGAMQVFGGGLTGIFNDIAARLGAEGNTIRTAPVPQQP